MSLSLATMGASAKKEMHDISASKLSKVRYYEDFKLLLPRRNS